MNYIPLTRKKIDFFSNPPFNEEFSVEPATSEDGRIINKVVRKPSSNVSPLDGFVFDEATMSLRAKLNMGLPMNFVSNPNIADFSHAYAVAQRFEHDFSERLSSLEEGSVPAAPSDSVNS